MSRLEELFRSSEAGLQSNAPLSPSVYDELPDISRARGVYKARHIALRTGQLPKNSDRTFGLGAYDKVVAHSQEKALNFVRANFNKEIVLRHASATFDPTKSDAVHYLGNETHIDIQHFDWLDGVIVAPETSPKSDVHRASLEAQIEELRADAAAEGEPFHSESAEVSLSFCELVSASNEPTFFLLANGNLRAVWQNAQRDEIGVQFFPDGLLQYVILQDRDGRTFKSLGETIKPRRVIGAVELEGLSGLWYDG